MHSVDISCFFLKALNLAGLDVRGSVRNITPLKHVLLRKIDNVTFEKRELVNVSRLPRELNCESIFIVY